MRKTFFPILFAAIAVSVIMASCSQNTATSTTAVTPTESLNQFFTPLRPVPQYITVNAGRDTVVYGTDSTLLHFYANSFVNTSGGIVTSGTVLLALNEIIKPGDFILNTITTINAGFSSILSSGGAIILNASLNGETVNANKYGVGFKQSAASSAPMQLYYGNSNNTDTITAWTQGTNTTPGTTSSGTTQGVYYTSNTSLYFNFDSCSSFGHVSCNFPFSSTAALTNVSVSVPSTDYNSTNTEIFIILPANRIIIPIEAYNANTNTFSIQATGLEVPTNAAYELVTITYDGEWLFSESTGTTSSGMNIVVTPSVATWTGLESVIGTL